MEGLGSDVFACCEMVYILQGVQKRSLQIFLRFLGRNAANFMLIFLIMHI